VIYNLTGISACVYQEILNKKDSINDISADFPGNMMLPTVWRRVSRWPQGKKCTANDKQLYVRLNLESGTWNLKPAFSANRRIRLANPETLKL